MNIPVNYPIAKFLYSKEVRFENWQGKIFVDGEEKPHMAHWYVESKEIIPAPTIADVVMWFYEKHEIWINVCPYIIEYNNRKDCIGFIYLITKLKTYLDNGKMYGNEDTGNFSSSNYYSSPTEAYEAAFGYTLNNLINGV